MFNVLYFALDSSTRLLPRLLHKTTHFCICLLPILALQLICLGGIVSASSDGRETQAAKRVFSFVVGSIVFVLRNTTCTQRPPKDTKKSGWARKNGDTWRPLSILHTRK